METSVKAQQWLIGIFSVLLIVILTIIAGYEMHLPLSEPQGMHSAANYPSLDLYLVSVSGPEIESEAP